MSDDPATPPIEPEPLRSGSLFSALPRAPAAAENFEALVARPGLRIERIVSTGQATAAGEWFDQAQDEWVVLLTGAARLRIAGEAEERRLAPGDWMLLPAHARHRVEWTSPDEPTVWLAVHFAPNQGIHPK